MQPERNEVFCIDGRLGTFDSDGEFHVVKIHPTRWRGISIWIAIFTAAMIWVTSSNRELAQDGQDAKEALCAVKFATKARIDVTEAYLDDNPNGIPGVPIDTIKSGLTRDKTLLRSFNKLDCP